ncbi:MAG TPA: hypothetical protein VGF67_04340 [Ktedonobacteraceae bacterium]|jgi:thymidylate synthase
MTQFIQAQNLSLAWLAGLEHLLNCGGKDTNVIVEIGKAGEEDKRIRQLLDEFLVERSAYKKGFFPVTTVANTLFPQAFYYPQRGDNARSFLYQMQEQSFAITKRLQANRYGTYFQRMVAWPGKQKNVNQIEAIIRRLSKASNNPNCLSSAYEIGISGVEEEEESDEAQTEEIRIYQPGGDGRIMGFPCLSHISLTFFKKELHLTVLYRNQHFIRKAYGNYLGLSRLLLFLCQEIGCEPGTIVCVASHADAELSFGKRAITTLVQQCRSVLTAKQAAV